MKEVLKVKQLSKSFLFSKSFFEKETLYAVDSVSFSLKEGETLAILGNNGSGKSTLAKMLIGMIKPDSGSIFIDNQELEYGSLKQRGQLIRMVFQSADDSFNPRLTVGEILDWPLKQNKSLTKIERKELILDVLHQVGLSAEHINYSPLVMAVGQKQRVAIARALILQPKVIIFDEALAALDISVRSQMINLMLTLQAQHKISYIYISQDIGVLKHISDDIIVMDEGKIVEKGNTAEVLTSPLATITQKLVESYFGGALSADMWRNDKELKK